ncbi:MAG: hypothetical protein PHO20_03095 [Candidatus Peribacteraceae bacterium]|nr:hypothetical protein [Candidatus Peribacteraceae bacterium]MDD5739727.1 hypothetical protein [Candidatus Peribacteraceae bacterium]
MNRISISFFLGKGAEATIPQIFAEGCKHADIDADEAFWKERISSTKLQKGEICIERTFSFSVEADSPPSADTICVVITCDEAYIYDLIQFLTVVCYHYRAVSAHEELLRLAAVTYASVV